MKSDLNDRLRRARKDPSKRVIAPTPEQLQIDIDGAKELLLYGRQRAMLERRSEIAKGWRTAIEPSFRKNHVHITVNMRKRWNVYKRIAFAVCLGSDPVRELLNLIRAEKGQRLPIAFFEPIKRKERNAPSTRP